MGPLVFLLLLASGAFPELECADGSNNKMPSPTEPTIQKGEVFSEHRRILLQPMTVEVFTSETARLGPSEGFCMKRVKCDDDSSSDEAPQTDEEHQDVPRTLEVKATAETSTASSVWSTRPPLTCSIPVQTMYTYRGHCVRLSLDVGGCRSGSMMSPMQPPCHPPPKI
ncbi:uncharacterized protein LOC126150146 [Schistocerca cancellata]|uniref:uncharacterized protein LOC126150146 n=1 Tax=Schistocerca cancellata TaxID=274614 RepID=UPI00211924E0|nr:uncharacterized protein LOC126150146 [Schistocerca cancellata]